jgi:uncharacterized iron-regulated membrane protein
MRFLRSIRFWRTFHLWLSLLLSLQLLAWFGGGLIMSVLPINEVRGDHLRAPTPTIQWSQANVSPAQLKHLVHMQLPNAGLLTGVLSLKQRGELPVYQLQNGPKSQYFSAIDGSKLQPLNEKEVHQLAQQLYRGGGKLQQARLISELPIEARGLRAPVWQVTFQDADNSVFYLEPILGQLLRVRTDNWRLYDFVWMLHIMDYKERDNFNHGLLIASSALALLFTISGLVLLVMTLRRKTSRSSLAGQ